MLRTSGKQPKPKTDCFTWTDHEIELLLKVTNQYKVQKSTESVDWESVQSRYGDILDMFQAEYPKSENAAALGKEYLHMATFFTTSIGDLILASSPLTYSLSLIARA